MNPLMKQLFTENLTLKNRYEAKTVNLIKLLEIPRRKRSYEDLKSISVYLAVLTIYFFILQK